MTGFTLDEARALLGTRVTAMCALTFDLHATPRASHIAQGEEGTIIRAERSYDETHYVLMVQWDEYRQSPHGYSHAKRCWIDRAYVGRGLQLQEPLGEAA